MCLVSTISVLKLMIVASTWAPSSAGLWFEIEPPWFIVCCWKYLILINKQSAFATLQLQPVFTHQSMGGSNTLMQPPEIGFLLENILLITCVVLLNWDWSQVEIRQQWPFFVICERALFTHGGWWDHSWAPSAKSPFQQVFNNLFPHQWRMRECCVTIKMFSWINQRGARVICSPVAQQPSEQAQKLNRHL